jgi:Icc-related predicted phosphoesterase
MKLLIFSDIHADYPALEKLLEIEADLYFAAGDLVNWARGLERVGPILAQKADRMYVMPGNHESESDIAGLCSEFGLHDFHGKTLHAGAYEVAGLGYSNPTPFDTPGEYTEEELARRLEPFAGLTPLVLICHCPPKDTLLDRASEGAHFGSTAVRDFIERNQPEYFFCGHIHEAAGAETSMGKTRGWNVGKKGYLLEI